MTGVGGQKVQTGLTTFKFYIHDTAEGYALEMSGPFTRLSVPELECCWETAKPTLKARTLTLDLRGLTLLDDDALQWVTSMALAGAVCLPGSFLRDIADGFPAVVAKRNVLLRLSDAVRGYCQTKTVNADSVRVTGR